MSEEYIYGIRATLEGIESGREINKVLLQTGIQGELLKELLEKLKHSSIPYQTVPVQKLNRVTRQNHQGVIAFVAPIEYGHLETIVEEKLGRNEKPLILILDRVTDVRNLGSIARSAECLGVDAIVIPKRGAAQVTADAIKTSAGALHKIAVCREENLRDTMLLLQQYGVRIAACSEKATTKISDADLTEPLALIMGSEENGVSKELWKRCDLQLRIPMSGEISSMNVSVSCGIALYEVNRQRNA